MLGTMLSTMLSMMLEVEPLEDRTCPTTITNHGGPVLAHPLVSTIYVNNTVSQQGTLDDLTNLMVGPYSQILSPYGVGTGSYTSSVSLPTTTVTTNDQVTALITQEIATGALPQPTPNSLYMVWLPQMVTDSWAQNDAGYHSTLQYKGTTVAYTVGTPAYPWAQTHEYAEAATDPVVGTGWFGINTNEEVCDDINAQLFQIDGYAFNMVVSPSGQTLVGPDFTEQQALGLLTLEQWFASVWSQLAHAFPFPWVVAQASASNTIVQGNPMANTPLGLPSQTWGEELAALWLEQVWVEQV